MPLEYEAIRKSFDYAAKNYEKNAVLQKEVLIRLLERLEDERSIDMNLNPQTILDLGCGTGWAEPELLKLWSDAKITGIDFSQAMLNQVNHHPQVNYLMADVHDLPVSENSIDMVFSNMMLHWSNETDVFDECLRVLKPGGLLLMSCLGETSLFELKQVCESVNNKFNVHDFSALHDLGDKLLQKGFEEVVVNAEIITLTYEDVQSLMKDIKASGGQNVDEARHKGLIASKNFHKIVAAYEQFRQDGKLPASYEIVYLRAKKKRHKVKIPIKITSE